jgi:hypothetical protein
MMSVQEYDDARSGWLTFAAMLMFAVGFVRIVSAIRYFDDGQEINNLTAGLFGDSLWAWGIWDLCVAALALFAGVSLLSGGGYGRVVGYIWGVLVIVQGFLIIQQAPWYGAGAITVAILVIYGLATTSGWRAAEVGS